MNLFATGYPDPVLSTRAHLGEHRRIKPRSEWNSPPPVQRVFRVALTTKHVSGRRSVRVTTLMKITRSFFPLSLSRTFYPFLPPPCFSSLRAVCTSFTFTKWPYGDIRHNGVGAARAKKLGLQSPRRDLKEPQGSQNWYEKVHYQVAKHTSGR